MTRAWLGFGRWGVRSDRGGLLVLTEASGLGFRDLRFRGLEVSAEGSPALSLE